MQSLQQPDGLAFSDCGTWLAVANHGGPSVSLFRRQNRFASDGKPVYGPEPVAVLQDLDFRHPHSVAFTAAGHLVVTNAGANYLNVYRITERWLSSKPSLHAVTKLTTNDENIFRSVNTSNKMEGGPKGVAIHGNELAVCSPEMGIRIYAFRER